MPAAPTPRDPPLRDTRRGPATAVPPPPPPPPPYSHASVPASNPLAPASGNGLDDRMRSLRIGTAFDHTSSSPTTTTTFSAQGRPASSQTSDSDSGRASEPAYVHYRIYSLDGAVQSKCAFQKEDPYIGRVLAIRITPPHTVLLVKRFLCMQENIPNAEDTDLFETISSDIELVNDNRLSILTGDGPGSKADEPVALIFKNVPRAAPKKAPPAAPSSTGFDPTRFSSPAFQLKNHTATVFGVTISADGTRFVSSSKDGTICVWDMEAKKVVVPMKPSSVISSVALSPDGKEIVSGQYDPPYIRMWDAKTGAPTPRLFEGHKTYVLSVAYSPNGRRFASGSFGKTIRVWDAVYGGCMVGPIQGHGDWIRSVAFSPDGSRIVSGSIDRTLRVWDSKTGKSIGLPFQGHTDTVCSVAFSPDGKSIISGSWDKTVRIWDAGAAMPTSRCCTGHMGAVECITFTADGRYFLSGSLDGTIRIWDLKLGQTVVTLQTYQGRKTDKDAIWCVAISTKGDCIVAGTAGGTIHMWRKV